MAKMIEEELGLVLVEGDHFTWPRHSNVTMDFKMATWGEVEVRVVFTLARGFAKLFSVEVLDKSFEWRGEYRFRRHDKTGVVIAESERLGKYFLSNSSFELLEEVSLQWLKDSIPGCGMGWWDWDYKPIPTQETVEGGMIAERAKALEAVLNSYFNKFLAEG